MGCTEMSNKFVVIDLETTGNLPKTGEKIIQFAAVVIENGLITDRFSTLINPQKTIPVFIEELTGINDEMVQGAPLFPEIAAKVMELLDGAYFVAHNVLFDLSFLQEELIRAGFEGFYGSVLDTVEMARILYPTADGYKLADLAEKENLQHDRPHQADSDAEVTAELFLIFLKRLSMLPLLTLRQLTHLAGGLKSDLQQLLDEIILEKELTNEDLPDALEVFEGLVLKTAVNNPADSGSDEYQYPESEEAKVHLLSKSLETFAHRSGQLHMMDAVYQCFQNEMHTLIEAGTGVGKSLGYLIPTAYFSKRIKQPIVVSTHTIQLQEQLLKKEIPLLKRILPFEVRTVLLKGRSHYLCLEKFYLSLLDENDNYDTTLTKMQILVWLMETNTGDKDELNLSSGGLLYWNKIKNEQTVFSHKQIWRERDFYQRAKNLAAEADIIITNHSLLLSDLKKKGSVLPNYDFVVIDEAHQLEKAAVQFFGSSLDYLATRMLVNQFGQLEQAQLFDELEDILAGIPESRNQLPHPFEINQIVIDLSYEIDEFFRLIAVFVKPKLVNSNKFYRTKVRFSQLNTTREQQALVHSAERLTFLLKDLQNAIQDRLEWASKQNQSLTDAKKIKLEEIHVFLSELGDLRDSIKKCFMNEFNEVKWIEIDIRAFQNVTTFMAQPADVAGKLKTHFFTAKKGVILTSATLTVNGSFGYCMRELGLDPDSTKQLAISSPFEYHKQVQLFVPDDLPEINTVTTDEYVIAITEQIITIAEAAKGRMLILFTAYDMLKKTYDLMKESGFLNDYVLIAQGITSSSRTRLTRNFQRFEKAILLGTSSFWEGVDIPGEDLSCLIIVRLPFSPPDEPLTEAKCRLIEKRGGNPFYEYSLPEAVLRFKQGFGRLIRSETDKGIIVIFDKRIITAKYGKFFLESIPKISIKNGTINDLVKIIQSWIS